MTDQLEEFRISTSNWLEENCPASMREAATTGDLTYGGRKAHYSNPDSKRWLDMMAKRGWTVPDWPKEYGGGGLNKEQAKILKKEMARLHCRPPLIGHGTWMLGPALLEFGNDEQKREHLPKIARGEIRWCQGYSEPGAGSDLASVRCKAEDKGDYFLVNGSKTWTTDAEKADWIFCLVRTNPDVKKQIGISFLLIDMNDPGIATKPIRLISGESHFCETFFDNVKVAKKNLVGELNRGWSIAKALLVHERSMMSDMQSFIPKPKYTLEEIAKSCIEKLNNPREKAVLSDRFCQLQMNSQALALTQQRLFEEMKAQQPSAAGLIMKYYGTENDKNRDELIVELLGHSGLGWEGEGFEEYALEASHHFLLTKGISIGGGTSEIQLNIIAKHALGLPD